MDNLWQSPFVNVFKHFNLPAWKKATKEGEVVSLMDKMVKGTVYRITGSVPAGNYIQLPKTNTQSLGLTGRYFYLLFKPIPSKHFVVHLDIATTDNLVIRLSFSNLFKSFKSTSTWLQFPFVCSSPLSSLPTYISEAMKDQSGPAPMVTRWTLLCLDLQHILSLYLNRRFLYVKSIRLCANLLVKNVFTSDTLYDPGLSMGETKRQGLTTQDTCPLPRDMTYPVGRGEHWHDLYDWIRFPNDGGHKAFDSIQVESPKSRGRPVTKSEASTSVLPKRVQPRTLDVSKCVSDRVSMIHKLTAPKQVPKYVAGSKELPEMPLDMSSNYHDEEVQVYASTNKDTRMAAHGKINHLKGALPSAHISPLYKSLEPDPIMRLNRIIGFGGATFRDALWSADGASVVYPCHAVVVAMRISNGQQRFFVGHTDKVSCLTLTSNSQLLASGQTGQMSVVRVWKFSTRECLAFGKVHVSSLSCLSFSSKGVLLCGVGKDGFGKNMVVIWNTSRVAKQREMTVISKAHTDVDISRIIISPFDETRMVSCGHENVRLWKIKEGALRSAPFSLGEHTSMDFTDICFGSSSHLDSDPQSKLIYSCTRSGHIFELDMNKLNVHQVRRLLPLKNRPKKETKIKNGLESGDALSINSIHLNETFCVTGSDDGYLRLWPLDFAHVYLEAEHEGPVTTSRLSCDGLKILAGTSSGNLGILDVSLRQYTTVMRSHTGHILCLAVDPLRKHLATVSVDHTIRVWDVETLQQLYDFSALEECPCSISYHPTNQVFACGFQNGSVKVFNVESTCLVVELRHLRGEVTGVIYSPDGSRLYSCCSLGVAAIYDSSTEEYKVVRVITGLIARGKQFGPLALAISPCGRRAAFVGPTESTVTVADARCLDELVRIDVSNLSVDSSSIDSAERLTFSPAKTDHLLVTTTNNRLVKFDAKNGRLLQETEHIHRTGCSAVCVSNDGLYMATGGDKTIKIWDYNLQLDISFQVFIGHSENVSRIIFTSDGKSLISAGEAIYLWDFLARNSSAEEWMVIHDSESQVEVQSTHSDEEPQQLQERRTFPRAKPVRSAKSRYERVADRPSSVHGSSDFDDSEANRKEISTTNCFHAGDRSGSSAVNQSVAKPFSEMNKASLDVHVCESKNLDEAFLQNHHSSSARNSVQPTERTSTPPYSQPSVFCHYKQREKTLGISQRRYTAPTNQAGLQLSSVIGFNCNGRNNMVWHPDTGLFAYSSGCVVVIEDLSSGKQKHLLGHTEEVSCLALQHDSQCLASASPAFAETLCQICVWDTQTKSCKKILMKHKFAVQCLAYSRDDRFLISVGDYRECNIVVWDTIGYQVVASSKAPAPIHCLKWDPFTVNEFVSVGEQGSVLFWLLDETSAQVFLNVHEADLPEELDSNVLQESTAIFTSVAYASDKIVYIGTDSGKVTAWDTQHNSCFMHWDADSGEITKLVSRHSRLMTAGTSYKLKLWAVGGVSNLRSIKGKSDQRGNSGLVMEDEMTLDGSITCAEFDDMLDMGITGTSAGTLWYINWAERTSIRLVSGHHNKINGVAFTSNNLMLTGGDDGSVRVWSVTNREQAIQFQVKDQSCTCLAVGPLNLTQTSLVPLVAGGYSDGTVRVFDVNKVEMLLKMHPHAVTVTAIAFSPDGTMIVSGASDGLVAVSSSTTGMTVRIIGDHKGVAISNVDVTLTRNLDLGITAPTLWLASSIDRRVSVWCADWAKDFCELVDWLTFPAPAVMPDGSKILKNDLSHFYQLPPTLARFSPDDADTILYTGYGTEKMIQFYSITHRKVMRSLTLTHFARTLDISPDSGLIAVGISEHLLKLIDYHEGSFQDFTGHSEGVTMVRFSPTGTKLLTVSHNEIFLWDVLL